MKNKKQKENSKLRWKKGQSCLANPEFRKFRDAAKKKEYTGFESSGTSSGLTSDALKRLDDPTKEGTRIEFDDSSTWGGSSVATSRGSSCTNATFKRVISNFSMSSVEAHKEVLAVLETVAEMIKSQSDDDSDVKYLLTLLHLIKSDKVTEPSQISAILYLLSLCVKRVPQQLLRMKFGEASKIVLEALQGNMDSDSQSLARSAVTILATLLRSLEFSSWKEERTKHIFYCILCLTDCNKAKVRKIARHSVGAVLRGSRFMLRDDAPPVHPAAHDTFEFCRKKLEERQKGTDDTSFLFIVALLGDIVSVFSKCDLEKTCRVVVGMVTPADAVTSTVCLVMLRQMFALKPREDALTAEFSDWIITELFKCRPNVQIQITSDWLKTMEKALTNLSKLRPKLFLNKLPDFFKACLSIMSNQPARSKAAAASLMACIGACTSDVIGCASDALSAADSPIRRIVEELVPAYSMFFLEVMESVLKVTDTLMEFLGKSCGCVLKKILKHLNALREMENFEHKGLLMKVFGTSVRTMGPQNFLEVLPLRITGEDDDMDFPMSWILPTFRDHVQDTSLAFFIDYFMPLSVKINSKCKQLQSGAAFRVYDAIKDQIWSLLPGFCTRPNDLVEAFPKLAKLMSDLMQHGDKARIDVLASLRRLIKFSADGDKERAVMSRYSGNYASVLCTMYTTTKGEGVDESIHLPESHNLAVLETFKVCLKVAPEKVVSTSIAAAVKKYGATDASLLQKKMIMDLMIAFVPHLKMDVIEHLYSITVDNIQSKDISIQKKAYKLLEEICLCQSTATLEFAERHEGDICSLLVESFKSSHLTSKAPRLRCISNVVRILKTENQFVSKMIPEAVLCLSTPGSSKKQAALNLLIEVGDAFVRWNRDSSAEDAFKKFMEVLVAGLASNDVVVKSTIVAIAGVVDKHRKMVGGEVLQMIADNLVSLLKSTNREILKCSIDLLKVVVARFSDAMSLHVKRLVTVLTEMDPDLRRHFRFQTKEIYMRLVKKFGHVLMMEMVPQEFHKMINHIRKDLVRAEKKKKTEKSDEDDEAESKKGKTLEDDLQDLLIGNNDDDDDDDDDIKSTKRRLKKASDETVFMECGEGMDFLDPSSHKSIKVKKIKKDKQEIKMIDGKMDLTGMDGDESLRKKKRNLVEDDDSDVDDKFDDKSSQRTQRGHVNKNTKKRNRPDDDGDDDDDDAKSNFSYKPGGKGIHRKNPSKQPNTKKQKKENTSKGSVQPYSYIPLDKKMLNKRHRNKYKV